MRGAVASDGGGRDIEKDDQESSPRPWHNGERKLANSKGYAARHEAHGDSTEHAGPVWNVQMPIVRPTKNGSAKTARLNST